MPLGQTSAYVDRYDPSLLYPLARAEARAGLETTMTWAAADLPFVGMDVWTAYELTWLDSKGRPDSAVLTIEVACNSPNIVESKSLKLYLNSFAQSNFTSVSALQKTLNQDLDGAFGSPVRLTLASVDANQPAPLQGLNLDKSDVPLSSYQRTPTLLVSNAAELVQKQALYTHQFRSLCPVTGQPDFASLWVEYTGPRIDPGSLFAYLVSYRMHSGFHESAVEQIFLDMISRCGSTELTVYGRFLRRGGIDINPLRSTHQTQAPAWRVARQ